MLLTMVLATLALFVLVCFYEIHGNQVTRNKGNPKLRQYRPPGGAVDVVFLKVKFVPKKPNLICHIINNVHKEGVKRMGLMDLTKVSCLHCVKWL